MSLSECVVNSPATVIDNPALLGAEGSCCYTTMIALEGSLRVLGPEHAPMASQSEVSSDATASSVGAATQITFTNEVRSGSEQSKDSPEHEHDVRYPSLKAASLILFSAHLRSLSELKGVRAMRKGTVGLNKEVENHIPLCKKSASGRTNEELPPSTTVEMGDSALVTQRKYFCQAIVAKRVLVLLLVASIALIVHEIWIINGKGFGPAFPTRSNVRALESSAGGQQPKPTAADPELFSRHRPVAGTSLLPIVQSYTRAELLSSLHPPKDMHLLPSLQTAFAKLVSARPTTKNEESFPSATFPSLPWVQVSNDLTVASRGVKVGDRYSCYGGDAARQHRSGESIINDKHLAGGFDFTLFPIGCFGDPIALQHDGSKSCQGSSSPSCKLGAAMNKMAACVASDFVVHRTASDSANRTVPASGVVGAILGDNFYPNGITGWRDNRIEEEMLEKFWKFPLLGGGAAANTSASPSEVKPATVTPTVKYYATVGNHDLKPRFQFSGVHNHPHWVMPDVRHVSPLMRSERVRHVAAGNSTTVQLFLISTQWGFQNNDPFMASEAEWLDKQLAASQADWKIVGTHEQIFGFMGFDHGEGLMKHVHPVLIKHKVRLFVCAHQHSVHMFMTPGNYYQVTSAGFAEASVHTLTKPRRPPGYYHQGSGAVAILLTRDVAHVVAFRDDESLIFAHQIVRETSTEAINTPASGTPQPRSIEPLVDKGEPSTDCRLSELHANGVDPNDPMWLPSPKTVKCDRFKLKESFINATDWDRSASDCWMYERVAE